MNKTTLAMIVGTRDFFPADPVLEARREVLGLLDEMGVEVYRHLPGGEGAEESAAGGRGRPAGDL